MQTFDYFNSVDNDNSAQTELLEELFIPSEGESKLFSPTDSELDSFNEWPDHRTQDLVKDDYDIIKL